MADNNKDIRINATNDIRIIEPIGYHHNPPGMAPQHGGHPQYNRHPNPQVVHQQVGAQPHYHNPHATRQQQHQLPPSPHAPHATHPMQPQQKQVFFTPYAVHYHRPPGPGAEHMTMTAQAHRTPTHQYANAPAPQQPVQNPQQFHEDEHQTVFQYDPSIGAYVPVPAGQQQQYHVAYPPPPPPQQSPPGGHQAPWECNMHPQPQEIQHFPPYQPSPITVPKEDVLQPIPVSIVQQQPTDMPKQSTLVHPQASGEAPIAVKESTKVDQYVDVDRMIEVEEYTIRNNSSVQMKMKEPPTLNPLHDANLQKMNDESEKLVEFRQIYEEETSVFAKEDDGDANKQSHTKKIGQEAMLDNTKTSAVTVAHYRDNPTVVEETATKQQPQSSLANCNTGYSFPFDNILSALNSYHSQNGNATIPQPDPTFIKVITELVMNGIEDEADSLWERNFTKLQEYRTRAKDCDVPVTNDLGKWVLMQRELYAKINTPLPVNVMNDGEGKQLQEEQPSITNPERYTARFNKLLNIGFDFTTPMWDTRYQKLIEYKNEYKTIPSVDCPGLGIWVVNQRLNIKYMSKERAEALDEIGFVWNHVRKNRNQEKWDKKYEELVQYKIKK